MASWGPEQVNPDTKPAKRIKATKTEWEAIREHFAHATCVSCSVGGDVELHHILPRSQGGDDLVLNLVAICRTCHTRLEGHESGWRRVAAKIRKLVTDDNERRHYQEDHAGESFNNRYPALIADDPDFRDDLKKIWGLRWTDRDLPDKSNKETT